jgi:hypothetical protein
MVSREQSRIAFPAGGKYTVSAARVLCVFILPHGVSSRTHRIILSPLPLWKESIAPYAVICSCATTDDDDIEGVSVDNDGADKQRCC